MLSRDPVLALANGILDSLEVRVELRKVFADASDKRPTGSRSIPAPDCGFQQFRNIGIFMLSEPDAEHGPFPLGGTHSIVTFYSCQTANDSCNCESVNSVTTACKKNFRCAPWRG